MIGCAAKEVHADFAQNLSAIVETQKLIQTLQLDLGAAAKLVAERVQKITSASGAAIGILDKGELFIAPDRHRGHGCRRPVSRPKLRSPQTA